ncbi:MAG: MBL fold metallo-hydrolase [Proteobacteria bacterium]|nr:MBL fold metallo-hydrolase [Pseudomonadota bacterium]MBU1714954.1 MBL fold metallo-hydrolase [Pseudomonadota bacterium]
MKIRFIGVGEACDPCHHNTSLVVHHREDGLGHLMFDCGFTVPHAYFYHYSEPNELEAVWISHFHGDHFFGLPLLILKLGELGRSAPLKIIGSPGIENVIRQVLELAYGSLSNDPGYRLDFLELAPGQEIDAAGVIWRCAVSDHSRFACGVRIDAGKQSIFYSGDGRPTVNTTNLAKGCDLVVHEAYSLCGEVAGHGTIDGCLEFARLAGVKNLALVHLKGTDRLSRLPEIKELIARADDLNVLMPEAGAEFDLALLNGNQRQR